MILTNHGIIQSFKIGEQLYLNTYPAGMGGYSMYKIDINYTGSCLRVRRSSDNTESDIGFDVSGALDESALLSFVGTGGTDNGYVTKWYVQGFTNNPTSIYNLDYVNANSATQPSIVTAGAVTKYDSKPAINFPSVGKPLGRNWNTSGTKPSSLSWHVVLKSTRTDLVIPFSAGTNQYAGVGDNGSGTAIVYREINGAGVSTPPSSGTYKNGTSVTVTTRDQMFDQFYASSLTKFTVWSAYGLAPAGGSWYGPALGAYTAYGFGLQGYIGEIIFHLSNEVSNNTGETDNIKTRWGI